MKIILSVIFILLVITAVFKISKLKNVEYQQPEILVNKKILTVYYSNGKNTKKVAQNIHSVVGGDIKEVQLIEKYPNNIFKMSKLVRKQIKKGYLPEIEDIDISNYDVIFIGSPIWNFSLSLPVKTFLKNNSFESKELIPFFTFSGGANKNKVFDEVKSLANSSNVEKPLFMFEDGIIFTKEQVVNWLNKSGNK